MNPKAEIRWSMAGHPRNTFVISMDVFLFLAAKSHSEEEFRAALYNEGAIEHEQRHKAVAIGASA